VDHSRAAAATFQLVRQFYGQLDLGLPRKLTDDLAAIDRQLSGHGHTVSVDPRTLTSAVVTVLAAGKDPADDPDVQQLLIRAQLGQLNVGQHLDALAADRRLAALVEHPPALLDQLATVVDQAAQTLTDARALLPPRTDLTNPQGAAVLRAPDALHAWGRARQALDQLRTAVQVWTSLANTAGHGHTTKSLTAPLILADLDADQLDRLGSRDALAPAYAGLPLDLATFDSYVERIANIERERQRRATQQEAEGRRRAGGAFR
jgi:hypothetical protein